MTPIFIDTSAFFAFLVKRDPAHAAALRWLNELGQQNRHIVTSDHVIAETLTLLRVRGYNHLCQRFCDSVESSRRLRIETTPAARFWQTIAFFLKHADKGYSFTDCLSFIVMRELKLTQAMTTDRHFDQAGFTALLTDEA